MAYGLNQPFGLRPTKSILAAPLTYNVETFYIKSGYANNIYSGTPVQIETTAGDPNEGYITALNASPVVTDDAAGRVAQLVFGVFQGVKYVDATGTSQTLPYWQGGTVTQNGQPALASVIIDPNVVYDVQTFPRTIPANPAVAPTATDGLLISDIGKNVSYGYLPVAYFTPQPPGYLPGNIIGDNATGNSNAGILLSTVQEPDLAAGRFLSLKIIGLSQVQNAGITNTFAVPPIQTGTNSFAQAWNNALVVINNSSFGAKTIYAPLP